MIQTVLRRFAEDGLFLRRTYKKSAARYFALCGEDIYAEQMLVDITTNHC